MNLIDYRLQFYHKKTLLSIAFQRTGTFFIPCGEDYCFFHMMIQFICDFPDCLLIGIRNTPPVTASLITGMEPILNPMLVAAFYGERITMLSLAGCVIVVCTVLLYNVWLAKGKQPEG